MSDQHLFGGAVLVAMAAMLAATAAAPQKSEEAPNEAQQPAPAPEQIRVDEEVTVIGRPRLITPLPGVGLRDDQLSTNIQTATAEDIRNSGAVNATEFLNQQLQSITVRDTSGNPFQQDVIFRGFAASPLVATPQGLSIYLDGVRVNESFGDAVNWDLIPLNALESMVLVPGATPLFGLNTLGGALSLTTKSGFTSPGLDAAVRYGSWERRQAELAVGGHTEHFAGFLAYNRFREDGWRQNSPSDIEQIFGRFDVRTEIMNMTLTAMGADNRLIGNGTVPVSDLAEDRTQIFTSPDRTETSLGQVNLTHTFFVTPGITVSALGYYRRVDQANQDGAVWDDWERSGVGRLGWDCQRFEGPDDDFTGLSGNGSFQGLPGIPECTPNGMFNFGTLDQESNGFSLQLNWSTPRNQFVAGATYDRYRVRFEQLQQLGFIGPDRNIFLDPERPVGTSLLGPPFNGDPAVFIELCLMAGQDPATCNELARRDELQSFNFATANPIVRNRLRGVGETAGIFLYDAFEVKDGLTVTAGVRYNRASVRNEVEADAPTPLWTFTADAFENTVPACKTSNADPINRFQCTEENLNFESWNPAVGANWEINADTAVFVNISRGTRTPSAIELACARPPEEDVREGLIVGCTIPTNITGDPPLEQVRSTSFEVGARFNLFDYAVQMNVAAFQTDLENDILFLSLGRGNRGVFDNFGETRRRGFELGLDGDYSRWNWFVNYTFLEATFQSPGTVVNPSNSTAVRGFNAIHEFPIERGDEIPGNPNHSARAGIEFAVTPKLSAGFTLIAQSSSFARGNENNDHQPVGNDEFSLNAGNGTFCDPYPLIDDECFTGGRPFIGNGSIDGFWIVNFDASFRPTERLTVSLQVDNIFDAEFATTGNLGFSPFQGDSVNFPGAVDAAGFNFNSLNWKHDLFVAPGAPRAAWVSVRYRLGDW
jgi:outer membrane receptor protein involved in Fe transport